MGFATYFSGFSASFARIARAVQIRSFLRRRGDARSSRLGDDCLMQKLGRGWLFGAGNVAGTAVGMQGEKLLPHDFEKRVRQEPVKTSALAARYGPQIRTGPSEDIGLGKNDPGALVIQAETLFRRRRYLNRFVSKFRRGMRDRKGKDFGFTRFGLKRHDDSGRPILAAFFHALLILTEPKISIAKDHTGLGDGGYLHYVWLSQSAGTS